MIIKNPLIIKKAKLQAKIATPTTQNQTITFDSGYDGLSEVQVKAVTSAIDSNITAENIKNGVTILGVTGTLESGGGGTPEPTPTSSAFFTFDGANITGYNGSDENIILPKTYSKEVTIETLEGLWCPSADYRNWFEYVRYMETMEFFYNGEQYFANRYDLENLYSELDMRFPNGCYLTSAMASDAYAFEFLRYVNSSVNINGQSFANGISAFDYIMQNSILDVNFAGDVEVVKYIDGTDYEVTGIAYGAFEDNTTIETVNILDNILNIRSSAFRGCSSLTSITIPNSVTSIGDSTFSSCSSLTSITIPDSVTSIGMHAFSWCSSLESIIIPDSVTSVGGWAFRYCVNLTSVKIGSGIVSVGNGAFKDCSSLTSVTISNSSTKIGEEAFYNCTALSLIIMPDGVTSIGSNAFINCNPISVYVKDLEKWCSILFSGTSSNPLFSGGYLYVDYVLIKDELIIPDNVTQIKQYSFYKYTNLKSITIGNSVTRIGQSAFHSCTGLTSVTIGNSVTRIDSTAFSTCTGLTSITIPSSIEFIGVGAFDRCSGLTTITIKATTPPTLSNKNAIPSNVTKIYIPAGTLSTYQSATNWSSFASKFVELSA